MIRRPWLSGRAVQVRRGRPPAPPPSLSSRTPRRGILRRQRPARRKTGHDPDLRAHCGRNAERHRRETGPVPGIRFCSPCRWQRRAPVSSNGPKWASTRRLHGESAAVQINGCQQCFIGIGENRPLFPAAAFFLAASQPQVPAEPDPACQVPEVLLPHEGGPDSGQITLTAVRKAVQERPAQEEVDHRVTEKLEPLIVLHRPVRGLIKK